MIGIIIAYSHDVHVLYDLGSTHLYVFATFVLQLNKDLILLDWSFYVATLVGESLLVRYVYKSCELIMADREMVVDLIRLNMLEFDAILDMDWLAT